MIEMKIESLQVANLWHEAGRGNASYLLLRPRESDSSPLVVAPNHDVAVVFVPCPS